jgi:hypothetical protein
MLTDIPLQVEQQCARRVSLQKCRQKLEKNLGSFVTVKNYSPVRTAEVTFLTTRCNLTMYLVEAGLTKPTPGIVGPGRGYSKKWISVILSVGIVILPVPGRGEKTG